jgi:hypothetical protein
MDDADLWVRPTLDAGARASRAGLEDPAGRRRLSVERPRALLGIAESPEVA